MFYLKLNKITINDNGAIRSGLGIFGHDFATVQLVSLVTTNNVPLPSLDTLLRAKTPEERSEALRPAVANVVSSRVLTSIERVTDHAELRFGDTGLVVYEAETIPDSFNWILMAIKSEQALRDGAESVHRILQHQDFDRTAGHVTHLLEGGATLANPALAAGMQLGKFIAQVSAANLMQKGDRQLGVVSTSLNRVEHYFSGLRDIQGAPDSTGNLWYDYSIFSYERAIAVTRG